MASDFARAQASGPALMQASRNFSSATSPTGTGSYSLRVGPFVRDGLETQESGVTYHPSVYSCGLMTPSMTILSIRSGNIAAMVAPSCVP